MGTSFPDLFAALCRPFKSGEVKTRQAPGGRQLSDSVSLSVAGTMYQVSPDLAVPEWNGMDWGWAFDVFRDIPGYPGYKAGFHGSIWSSRRIGGRGGVGGAWHLMTPVANDSGYLRVTVRDASGRQRMRFVHQLVLMAWIGPIPYGMEVRHFPDPDKTNNSVVNLRFGTRQDNHADIRALDRYSKGSARWKSVLTESDIPEIRRLLREGVRQEEIGRRYGVRRQAIGDIKNGRNWSHVL